MNRRLAPLLIASFTTLLLFILFQTTHLGQSWHRIPQAIGLGDKGPTAEQIASGENILPDLRESRPSPEEQKKQDELKETVFTPGVPKTPGSNYTRTLVIARMKEENTSWIEEKLGNMLRPTGLMDTAIYVMDDPEAPLHPPLNKGHEAMAYLSYIVEHYESLADISIFMHSHRFGWHNNELQNLDAVWMITDLSPEHVTRQGYMNLRCHWDPGCPDWLHPEATELNLEKQEERVLSDAWVELFPEDPLPSVLSQPCCGQFALSKERIREVPLQEYIDIRDWLLRTPFTDYISGRIFEYLWQYIFTGNSIECPAMHSCYCDGYGICFGGPDEFDRYLDTRYWLMHYQSELSHIKWLKEQIDKATVEGRFDEAAQLEVPEFGRDEWLIERIDAYRKEVEVKAEDAWERGRDPANRAKEVGREWREGDGF